MQLVGRPKLAKAPYALVPENDEEPEDTDT
jgi:hypothetical protein